MSMLLKNGPGKIARPLTELWVSKLLQPPEPGVFAGQRCPGAWGAWPAESFAVVENVEVDCPLQQRDQVAQAQRKRELGREGQPVRGEAVGNHGGHLPRHQQVIFVHPGLRGVAVILACVSYIFSHFHIFIFYFRISYFILLKIDGNWKNNGVSQIVVGV
jgi:hypothetical protein